MLLRIIAADGECELKLIAEMRAREESVGEGINKTAETMLADIRERGYDAVCEYSMKLDGALPREVTRDELDKAMDRTSPELVAAMTEAAENIRAYHERMLAKSFSFSPASGVNLGQVVRGLTRVGLYVPGGIAAYPSTVLMNAIPAKVAGVSELIMVTPPTKWMSDAVLAAAKLAGVDRVFAVGGIQAIGGLTYGTGPIPRVDKIVGPGNAYVAAAKRMVYGQVDIDMIAGPSEILIIADESANPAFVAADLLSQAEHDELASSVLITDSMELALAVATEVERQAAELPRYGIIEKSLAGFGAAIVVDTLRRACEISDIIAPEHLEIMTDDPASLLPLIKNAGAVFLGSYSPEPLGDYFAGPSHVLPTSGSARFFSPLSTDTFLKKVSVISYGRDELKKSAEKIIAMAEAEGFGAHAASIRRRFDI